MNELDILIEQIEDPDIKCVELPSGKLITFLRELKDLREMTRKQSAVIESQARYIEQYIDRR